MTDNGPVLGGQNDYRELAIPEVLLMDQGLVTCHENVKATIFGRSQQVAIPETAPSHV